MGDPTSSPAKRKSRRTPARQRVLDLLQGTLVAVSPGELEKQLASLMNRVTLYRALQVLMDEGLVGRLTDGQHRVRYYAKRSSETISVQFSCDHCHELIALPGLDIPLPVLPIRYRLHTGQMLITGRCPTCQNP